MVGRREVEPRVERSRLPEYHIACLPFDLLRTRGHPRFRALLERMGLA